MLVFMFSCKTFLPSEEEEEDEEEEEITLYGYI
jgi:hypothetical protein